MSTKFQAYIQCVEKIIQLIENDEDYIAIQLDTRFTRLQQLHQQMAQTQPGPVRNTSAKTAPPKRKGASKSMKSVQAAYDKEVRMFMKPP